MATKAHIHVHPDPAEFGTVEFPHGTAGGPFVSLHLGGEVSVLISDPATLDALGELVASAHQWLTAAVAGQATLFRTDLSLAGAV